MTAQLVPCEFTKPPQTNVPGRSANAQGTAVTPGNNIYGAYTALGLTLTDDAYGIWVNFNGAGASATASDTIATIGVDAAGGTSFVDLIPDLLCSACTAFVSNAQMSGGIWFYFPLLIRSGSSLGCKASQNSAAPRNVNVYVVCPTGPSHPESLPRFGSFVRSYGITAASSSGTGVTPGAAAEGAYVQLSSGIADPCWFWQVAMGVNNTNMTTNNAFAMDLLIGAAGPVGRNVIVDQFYSISTLELAAANYQGAYAQAAVADQVWGRCQGNGVTQTGMSIAAYGVGG